MNLKNFQCYLIQLFYHKKYPFKNSIAIDVTSRCNLKCLNCQASCRQAPSDESISVEQINKFINKAIKLNYRWAHLDLYGGEPTLHPRFEEIIKSIKRYKDFNPGCTINIISNGTGPYVKNALSKLPNWVKRPLWNQDKGFRFEKKKYRQAFDSYNIAPIDLFKYKLFTDFSKGCWRIKICHGLALSRYGFYPCTPGASIDRVFGFDIGIKRLEDVNEKALRDQMKILCKYCGFFQEPNQEVTKEEASISWKKAYEEYQKQKPDLSLY